MYMNESFQASRALRRAGLGGLAAGAIVWSTAAAAAASESPVADLVDRVSPSVVTVYVVDEPDADAAGEADQQGFDVPEGTPFEKFFKRFGMPDGAMPDMPGHGFHGDGPRRGLGSGFVFDEDGFIITNNHVVEGADEVTVHFHDGTELEAEVVGADPRTDLALLKVDPADPLQALPLGDSGAIRVGETVIAVGNPFGLGGTVTKGIVSAIGRDINAGPYVDFIQTDAAINRGNSGGPLIDMNGEVIGVNSAIYSPSGGNVGVGFAIPSNLVSSIVAQLKEDGTVERGWLGVAIQTVTPEIAAAMDLDEPTGALVASVVEDSPAAGDLEVGDVILSYDGKPVGESRDLPPLVAATAAGDTVGIDVLRAGERRTVEVTVGELKPEKLASADAAIGDDDMGAAAEKLGATVATVSAETRRSLGLDETVDGAVVTSLKSGGAAAEAGLEVGDVIMRVGDHEIADAGSLDRALSELDRNYALLLVNRRGNQVFMSVNVDA